MFYFYKNGHKKQTNELCGNTDCSIQKENCEEFTRKEAWLLEKKNREQQYYDSTSQKSPTYWKEQYEQMQEKKQKQEACDELDACKKRATCKNTPIKCQYNPLWMAVSCSMGHLC